MPTNDERREVARRLREVEKHAIPDARISHNPMTVEFIAAAVFYDLPYVRGLFSRLADLIDPDTTTDTTKSPDLTTKCDRDALLALASGLEADADRIIRAARNARFGGGPRMGEAKHDAYEWRSIARRIRDALGESDG